VNKPGAESTLFSTADSRVPSASETLLRIVPPTVEFPVAAEGSAAVPPDVLPPDPPDDPPLPLPLVPPELDFEALLTAPEPAPAPTATAPTPVAAIAAATVIVNAASTPSGWPAHPIVFQMTTNRTIGKMSASAAET
jgi:hypothetical protein